MLITHKNILCRFSKNLEWATRVDLALAWVTENKGFRALHERASSLEIRAVVGFSGSHNNITQPAALKTLSAMGQLRRTAVNSPLFHPKVYIFRGAEKSVAWIGSANFTGGGFEKNEEMLLETSDTEDVECWFDRLWKQCKCTPLDESAIKSYENHRRKLPLRENVDESWVPPDPPPSPPVPEFKGWTPPTSWWKEKRRRASLLTFYLCRPGGIAWSDAVSKAKKYNDMHPLKTFTDREWHRQNRDHAKSWVKTSREKDHFPEFKSVGDDERGELVLKSGRRLSQKELVDLIDSHRDRRG